MDTMSPNTKAVLSTPAVYHSGVDFVPMISLIHTGESRTFAVNKVVGSSARWPSGACSTAESGVS